MNEPLKQTANMSFEQALGIAMDLQQRGHLLEAGEFYHKLLEVCPDHPDVLHFSGVLAHQLGNSEVGLSRIRQAALATPEHVDVHNNLGNILASMGRLDEAQAAYGKVIELAPGHAEAHNNLGVIFKKKGRLDKAVAEFQEAILAAPEQPNAYQNLASVQEKRGDHLAASTAWGKALELAGQQTKTLENLCRSLRKAGQIDRAISVARRWVALASDDPVAAHVLASLSGEGVPERASTPFVERTFDELAADYETVLAQLDYCVPELVAQAMRDEYGEPSGELVILDAGCGTGLCGARLRPFARRLVGVDLSAGMLEQARARSLYDDLVASELTAFLAQRGDAYDSIVLADTLPYFGDLGPLFAAVASRLRTGGCLLLSIEEQRDVQLADRYRLEPTGRYSHGQEYVRRQLRAAGMEPTSLVPAVIRKECEQPVHGLIVRARRQDPPPATGPDQANR